MQRVQKVQKIKNMNKYILGSLMSVIMIGLSGCAHMSAPPRCPDSSGISCARVDQLNTMIDRGELGVTPVGEVSKGEENPFSNFSASYTNAMETNQPLWQSEKVMQVWLAPYEDNSGNYHQASVIDTVVTPGHWSNSGVKSVNSSNE